MVTKREHRRRQAAIEAALADIKRQREILDLELEQADFASLDDEAQARFTARFDSLADAEWDLEQGPKSLDRLWGQRHWTWQDHAEARLVALNID